MEPSEYETIAKLEHKHWWYRGMAAISLSLLRSAQAHRPGSLRILDAGCGTGGMLRALIEFGRPFGVDFHPRALAHARGRAPVARASVEQLPFASNCFDLLTSFDVLYHRAVVDDQAALREFSRVLRPGGSLLLRVPALESLRGAHDAVVHTRRRYSRGDLRARLHAAGFRILRLTYANSLLLPVIYLRRRLGTAGGDTESDVSLPSPALNRALEFILALEKHALAVVNFPLGVSLFAVASKPR
jgi:SAM-dependent methyltransferase